MMVKVNHIGMYIQVAQLSIGFNYLKKGSFAVKYIGIEYI